MSDRTPSCRTPRRRRAHTQAGDSRKRRFRRGGTCWRGAVAEPSCRSRTCSVQGREASRPTSCRSCLWDTADTGRGARRSRCSSSSARASRGLPNRSHLRRGHTAKHSMRREPGRCTGTTQDDCLNARDTAGKPHAHRLCIRC
jgi:hypothetical protein